MPKRQMTVTEQGLRVFLGALLLGMLLGVLLSGCRPERANYLKVKGKEGTNVYYHRHAYIFRPGDTVHSFNEYEWIDGVVVDTLNDYDL